MLRTSLGQLLANYSLPEELRDYARVLDKKGIADLFQTIAERYPERYRELSKQLSDVGRDAATSTGGFSFGLRDMAITPRAAQMRAELQQQVDQILDDDQLDDETQRSRVVELVASRQKAFEDTLMEESVAEKNPFAMQILSGARGNPSNLKSLRGGDLLYTDHRGRVIPVPVLRSYAEGLSPVEYWAGAYGARKGVLDTKFGVADAGFMGKQLNQATHRLVVVGDDDDRPADEFRGYPVHTSDLDNEGAFLSQPVGGYLRNTPLTPRILKDLRQRGIDRILVRSPIVGGPASGVFGRDVGIRERGRVPPQGDFVGMAAAQALCLAKGTMVRMADGTAKAIECIQVGDMVLGSDLAGTLRPVRVLRVFDNGSRACSETVFRSGTGKSRKECLLSMVSTLDHKLLAVVVKASGSNRDRRPLAHVRPVRRPEKAHHRFYAKLGTRFDDTGLVDHPFAFLFGLLLGDGCYTGGIGSAGINFYCWDQLLLDDIQGYMQGLDLSVTPLSEVGQFRIVDNKRFWMRRRSNGDLIRNRVREFLLDVGVWGQSSLTKVLPSDVDGWSNDAIAALLSGLFATDGWVTVRGNGSITVGYASSSLRLIESVRRLLGTRFGIYGSGLHPSRKRRKNGGTYEPNYKLTINSWENVIQLSNIISPPGIKGRVFAAAISGWSRKPKSAERGRCSLVSQVAVGRRHTYDIEVDHPDHLFVLANGLIVSNSEKVTQGGLSSKHSGGVLGAGAPASGFAYLNQLIQTPKTFKGGAAHAQLDGPVTAIMPAPQGGTFVYVGTEQHYVPHGFDLRVQKGDLIEAGDVLSEGIPNPAEIVQHKGIGEGRRYFVDALRQAYKDAGMGASRRNIELLSRGLIDHVQMDEEFGEHVPDEIVSYTALERNWEPRSGSLSLEPQQAVGKYLERPVLHYTVGTPIRPSVVKNLQRFGVRNVEVHDQPAPFRPTMIRAMGTLEQDEDWGTQHLGSNLQKNTLKAVHTGKGSDPLGTSYVPAMMFNPTGFGQEGATAGWKATPAPLAPKPQSLLTGL